MIFLAQTTTQELTLSAEYAQALQLVLDIFVNLLGWGSILYMVSIVSGRGS